MTIGEFNKSRYKKKWTPGKPKEEVVKDDKIPDFTYAKPGG